jgi:hypothetical protein
MTTFRELLHAAAAPAPPRPGGFEAALQRGARLQARSRARRAAAASLAMAAIAFAAIDLTGPQEVRTVGPASTGEEADARSQEQPGPRPPFGPRPQAETRQGLSPAMPSSSPGTTVAPDATASPSEESSSSPVASGTRPEARLAFVSEGAVWTMRPDGSDRRRASSTGNHVPLAWSPDRSKLLVNDGSLGVLDVAAGTVAYIVRPDGAHVTGGDWSPDGTKVVYRTRQDDAVNVSGESWDRLWVADADGGNQRRLPIDGGLPSWSPDGSRLLFRCHRSEGSLCTSTPEGGDVRAVPVNVTSGVWSPDGEWIAGESGDRRIAVFRPDGSDLHTIGEDVFGSPTWTEDSRHVVYSRFDMDEDSGLYRVGLEGGSSVRIGDRMDAACPVMPSK